MLTRLVHSYYERAPVPPRRTRRAPVLLRLTALEVPPPAASLGGQSRAACAYGAMSHNRCPRRRGEKATAVVMAFCRRVGVEKEEGGGGLDRQWACGGFVSRECITLKVNKYQ